MQLALAASRTLTGYNRNDSDLLPGTPAWLLTCETASGALPGVTVCPEDCALC